MRRILLASAVAMLASAVAANAADLQRQAPPLVMPTKAPPYVSPVFDWSGFYIGANGGGGWGTARTDLTGRFNTSGGVAGGTAGYNAQFGSWVLGLEGDIDWSDVSGTSNVPGCPGCAVKNNWLGTARGRVGYAFGTFLPYVTGGLAVGDVNATAPGFAGQSSTQAGWAAGGGVEYALSRAWSAKVEYLRTDLGSFNCGMNCGATTTDNVNFKENLVRGGINLRF
jgi:outer membrane immunogenic protein